MFIISAKWYCYIKEIFEHWYLSQICCHNQWILTSFPLCIPSGKEIYMTTLNILFLFLFYIHLKAWQSNVTTKTMRKKQKNWCILLYHFFLIINSEWRNMLYFLIFSTVSTCPLPITVLDFIPNSTQPDLEIKWPCEVRSYWLSLQPFVRFVRFLLRYITPFIIILGKEYSRCVLCTIFDRSHIKL